MLVENSSYKDFIEYRIREKNFSDSIVEEYNCIQRNKNIVREIDHSAMVFVTTSHFSKKHLEELKYKNTNKLSVIILDWSNESSKIDALIEDLHSIYKNCEFLHGFEGCEYLNQSGKIPTFLWGPHTFSMLSHLCAYGYDGIPNIFTQKGRTKPIFGFFKKHFAEIKTILSHTIDSLSASNYLSMIKRIESGTSEYLPFPTYSEYCHPLVEPEFGDIVYEAGLHNHITISQFAKKVGASGRIIGFEPNAHAVANIKNAIIDNKCNPHKNIHIAPLGLWSEASSFFIDEKAYSGSKLKEKSADGVLPCKVVALDDYMLENNESKCNLIKMDIEGAEMEALFGARKTIQQHRPKLQICIYHKPSHYIEIPLWILKQKLGYGFFFGQHTSVHLWGEALCYATTSFEQ